MKFRYLQQLQVIVQWRNSILTTAFFVNSSDYPIHQYIVYTKLFVSHCYVFLLFFVKCFLSDLLSGKGAIEIIIVINISTNANLSQY